MSIDYNKLGDSIVNDLLEKVSKSNLEYGDIPDDVWTSFIDHLNTLADSSDIYGNSRRQKISAEDIRHLSASVFNAQRVKEVKGWKSWFHTNANIQGDAEGKIDRRGSVDFSPSRNEENEPIEVSSNQLPDISEVLPNSFKDSSQSPMATPIADMMREQEAHPQQTSSVDRLEKIIGKFGLRFPDFKAASYTGASERELDTHDYYKLGIDDLASSLASGGQYASNAHELNKNLYHGNANHLGQPIPDKDQALRWAEKIRAFHESRVAKLAEKNGAQQASPVFSQSKEQTKSYTAEAIKQVQEKQADGTSVPQGPETPGASSIESPPIQTDENKATSGDGDSMSWLDWLQVGLDGIGVVEPTPFADLANAGVSVGRAFMDPKNAGQHLMNAGISLISTIPYAGDLAKMAKGYGKGGKALGKSIESFASGDLGKTAYKLFGGTKNGGAGSQNPPISPGGSGSNPPGGNGGSGASDPPPFNPTGSGNGSSDELPSWLQDTIGKFLPLGVVIGSSIAAFRMLNQWVNKTAEQGKVLLEGQREYTQYSGAAGVGFLQYDARETMRKIEEARYLGSSVGDLARSQATLEDSQSVAKRPYDRLFNNIQTEFNYLASGVKKVTTALDPLGNALNLFFEAIDMAKPEDLESRTGFEEFLRDLDKKDGLHKAKPKLPAKEQK